MLGTSVVGADDTQATTQDRHLGSSQMHELSAIQHKFFRRHWIVLFEPIPVTIVDRLQDFEGCCISHFLRRISTPRSKWNHNFKACGLCSLLHADIASQYDH